MKMKVLIEITLLAIIIASVKTGKLLSNRLIVAYVYTHQCDESVVNRAKEGVNVVIWFSIKLVANQIGEPIVDNIDGNMKFSCIAATARKLKELNLPTTHLATIGGWGVPHVDTRFSAETWWRVLKEWNESIMKEYDFDGFDGIDINIEGDNDVSSPMNTITFKELNTIGVLCSLAKLNGWVVSLAPPQSYLDSETSDFSQSIANKSEWQPDFPYSGRNNYAYLLAKYGYVNNITNLVPTFDFISLQLYETYSRANHVIFKEKMNLITYFQQLVTHMDNGWLVRFSEETDSDIKDQFVKVKHTELVIGLANGWPVTDKVLLLWPDEIQAVHFALKNMGMEPKGYMFWQISSEGIKRERNGKIEEFWMAKGLNAFIRVRP